VHAAGFAMLTVYSTLSSTLVAQTNRTLLFHITVHGIDFLLNAFIN